MSQTVLRAMRKQTGLPTIPYITVVTDLGGAHPTWFNRQCDMTYVPTESIRKFGLRVAVPREKVRLLFLPKRRDL